MRASCGLALFDAAGTLIEPAEPVEEVYREHFGRYGWRADPGAIRESFRRTFANLEAPDFRSCEDGDRAERVWWAEVVGRTGAAVGIERSGREFEACFRGLFDHYASGTAWRVYPEVNEALESLKKRGWKLAVVSNFDRRLHRVLQELDLARAFDLVLTSADVRARKPSPALLHEAMNRLGETARRTRLVGDSLHEDGGAAAAAEIGVFILDRPRTGLRDFERWLEVDFFQNELA